MLVRVFSHYTMVAFMLFMTFVFFQCTVVAAKPPNFVFILSESLDGRLLRADSAAYIPNIRSLMNKNSVRFDTAYSNNPVCAPSRSSLWSGRAPHKIVHEHNGMTVNGVWNNYEGLPINYSSRLDQILAGTGYSTLVVGKTDYTVGGHTESCFLESFTFNVPCVSLYAYSRGFVHTPCFIVSQLAL